MHMYLVKSCLIKSLFYFPLLSSVIVTLEAKTTSDKQQTREQSRQTAGIVFPVTSKTSLT